MLIVLLSWFCMSFVFLSFGSSLLLIYEKLTGRNEEYSIVDTLLLGMAFLLIPLSIASIWLPSNEYLLLGFVSISILYCWLRRKCIFTIFKSAKVVFLSLSMVEVLMITIVILAILSYTLWVSFDFDALNYHYQLTGWNHSFSATPGIANLESRLGFNSSYNLLSALFSMRSFVNEPLFTLQSLLTAYIFTWIVLAMVQSKYSLINVVLLLVYSVFIWLNIDTLTTSSTDIVPALCIFYLSVNLALSKGEFKKKYLLFIIVPISLITIKLSTGALLIVPVLYFGIRSFKNRDFKTIIFIFSLGLLIISSWFVRNAIISGYLIYPLYEIDIFSFDWKVPYFVVALEKDYISDYAYNAFQSKMLLKDLRFALQFEGLFSQHKVALVGGLIESCIQSLCLLSPLLFLSKRIRTNRNYLSRHFAFCMLYVYILFWLFTAPDFRFVSGGMYAMLFIISTYIIFIIKRENIRIPSICKYSIISVVILMFCLSGVKRTYNFMVKSDLTRQDRSISSLLLKPYTAKEQANVNPQELIPKSLGQVVVYQSKLKPRGITYDIIPTVPMDASGEAFFQGTKFFPLSAVEARGNTLQDGFRPDADAEYKWDRPRDWWTRKLDKSHLSER